MYHATIPNSHWSKKRIFLAQLFNAIPSLPMVFPLYSAATTINANKTVELLFGSLPRFEFSSIKLPEISSCVRASVDYSRQIRPKVDFDRWLNLKRRLAERSVHGTCQAGEKKIDCPSIVISVLFRRIISGNADLFYRSCGSPCGVFTSLLK